jgi:peptidoglycan/LPS O-acetylase OafA/YrhL
LEPKIHLPGLNGIRAIAALAVIFSHIGLSLGEFGLRKLEDIDLAGYGVTIFFALSGFLITYLMLIEKSRFENINIRQFYIRRILRIWPLYYFYLSLSVITILTFDLQDISGNIWYYLLFSANIPFIAGTPISLLGHFWSLGVEEQFYLFWPWVVDKAKKLVSWIIIFIVIICLLKVAAWIFLKETGNVIPYQVIHVTRFHCMAIGALGAILFYRKHKRFLELSYSVPAQVISWLFIGTLAFSLFPGGSLIKHEVVAIISVILIVNVAGNKRAILKLCGRIPDYLGKISFGLYVYHPLIIFITARTMGSYLQGIDPQVRAFVIYPLLLLFTIVVAGISYEYFEKKFLALKTAFSRVESYASER